MSASASLYKCEDCKAEGVRTDAVSRPRVATGEIGADGKPVKVKRAFCQRHLDIYNGVATVDVDAITRDAYAALADYYPLLQRRAHGRQGISDHGREALADAMVDRFVQLYVRDTVEGRTVDARHLAELASRSHANLTRDILVDWSTVQPGNALGQTATGDSDSWDEDILAELDIEDQLALVAFADSDEADGREPTRNDAAAWIAGRTVAARTVTDRVLAAATRYAELKTARDAMLAY